MLLNTFGKDTTFCPMNLRYFPFDKHICEIEFMQLPRWGLNVSFGNFIHYEREGIVFQKSPAESSQQFLVENGEWDLVSLKLNTDPRVLSVVGSIVTYPIYTVTIELQRKPSFYVMILMLPSI